LHRIQIVGTTHFHAASGKSFIIQHNLRKSAAKINRGDRPFITGLYGLLFQIAEKIGKLLKMD